MSRWYQTKESPPSSLPINFQALIDRANRGNIGKWYYGQTAPLAGSSGGGGGITGLSVRYNDTDYAYPTTNAILGAFTADSNPIRWATIANVGSNPGLAFDAVNNGFASKYGTSGVINFFSRAAFIAAAALGPGNEPAFYKTVAGTATHGMAIDPVQQRIFESGGNTTFTIKDWNGTLLYTVTNALVPQFSMMHYDIKTQILYTTASGSTLIYGVKESAIPTIWDIVYVSSFFGNDGVAVSPFTGKMGTQASRVMYQDLAGTNIKVCAMPTTAISGNQEGFVVDPVDETFFTNAPLENYAAVADHNICIQYDPLKRFRKNLHFPNMFRLSDFKLNGNLVSGNFYNQTLTGINFSEGPPTDFGANTVQQIAGNWTFRRGESGTLEFRGSNTAPTTAPLAVEDYYTVVLYNPNLANSGWGDTVPSGWQATPGTWRYMQVRVKPIAAIVTPVVTPLDLGSKLIAWFTSQKTLNGEPRELVGARWDHNDSDRLSLLINVKGSTSTGGWDQSSTTLRPIYNEAGSYFTMEGGNLHFIGQQGIEDVVKALGACELHFVAVKPLDTNRINFFSLSNPANNNSQVSLSHNGSGATPPNYIGIRTVTDAGAIAYHGATDANGTVKSLITFRLKVPDGLGGFKNEILRNNVNLVLTDNLGLNTGQTFSDVPGSNFIALGRVSATTSAQGTQRFYEVFITDHLTSLERSTYLLNYLTTKGII